MQLKIAFLN